MKRKCKIEKLSSYLFHKVCLYFSYSQREYLSSQINISNPFFHRQLSVVFLYKKALIEAKIRTILKIWRSTQEAEGVALEMR